MKHQPLNYEQRVKFPFCECCGLRNDEIFSHLIKCREKKSVEIFIKTWKSHEIRQMSLWDLKTEDRIFIDWFEDSIEFNNEIEYCAKCGIKLDNEDHKSTWGSRWEPPEYLGYKCSKCGHEMKA